MNYRNTRLHMRSHTIRPLTLALILAIALPLIAPAQTHSYTSSTKTEASDTKEYSQQVGQFLAILLQDKVNVVYKCLPDSSGYVRWSSDNHAFDNAFILSVHNGTLKIQLNTEDIDLPDKPTLYVYSDFLTKVLNHSDADITVLSPQPCPKIEISQIGNGNIHIKGITATDVLAKVTAGMGTISLEGECESARYRMTGTGVIQADNLTAQNVSCKIMGGGSIGCRPLQTLRVRGIGSTKIYYRGTPEIDHKGGGKLLPIE